MVAVPSWMREPAQQIRTMLAQEVTGHVFRKVDAHHPVELGTDHHAPPCRPVRRREGFDDLKIGAAVDFETTQGCRHHEVEQLRVEERLDDRCRQIPLSFCVWSFVAHQSLQCQSPLNHVTLCCHVALLPVGRVSKVEMTTPMALICKVLFPSISAFETPPTTFLACGGASVLMSTRIITYAIGRGLKETSG